MSSYPKLLLAAALVIGVSACANPYDPGQRTVGGGLLGAGTGAAVGALAGGGRGAAIGAVAGGVLGAAGGAVTTPHVRSPGYDEGPPPGYYEQPPPPLGYYQRRDPYAPPPYDY